jgi:hypothetical protein
MSLQILLTMTSLPYGALATKAGGTHQEHAKRNICLSFLDVASVSAGAVMYLQIQLMCSFSTLSLNLTCVVAQIRTEVLKMLQSLPIDLTDEQRKSQMKKSQLGHVVMFLSKPEVEDNRANRRIARVSP